MKWLLAVLVVVASSTIAQEPDLRVGVVQHSFDHLFPGFLDQADAAVASGSNLIYATGVGVLGYEGLPQTQTIDQTVAQTQAYISKAKQSGIKIAIGYVCATSIMNLPSFDKNWTSEFRAAMETAPASWLQQDANCHALPSWYGGVYRPACMNNPHWREYEKRMVKLQLDAGMDGIFFDNPTVHQQGCYCEYCMKKFAEFAKIPSSDLATIRKEAQARREDFLRFRATTARDFLAEMRSYARTIKPDALITCNNSLNVPDRFFSQSRTYGYNIFEMSKAEDLIVLEDQSSQPRVLDNGHAIEFGYVYEMVKSIGHGKPLVAVTIADGNYHTPPNLTRLAMAEAAAHESSYMLWPTWPDDVRAKMCSEVRKEADVLRDNADLLNATQPRSDVLVHVQFNRWPQVRNEEGQVLAICQALARQNVPFSVVADEDLPTAIATRKPHVVIADNGVDVGSADVVRTEDPQWQTKLGEAVKPSLIINGPKTIRAVVRDQPERTIVHLLNLDILKKYSADKEHSIKEKTDFEDEVHPASNVQVSVRVPISKVSRVRVISATDETVHGEIPFQMEGDIVKFTIPQLRIAAIVVME